MTCDSTPGAEPGLPTGQPGRSALEPPVDWLERTGALRLQIENVIDGQRSGPSGATVLDKYGPRDGKLLLSFNGGTPQDVNAAVASARRAFEDGRWSRLAAQQRKDTLQRFAALIEIHRDELALLECLDTGKPIGNALNVDVPMAAANIRFNAELADKCLAPVYGVDRTSLSYQLIRPAGVVAAIIGWNFPLVLAAGKIGPALAMGNSLVLKPSEVTSLSAGRLAELALEAGIPEGVFNVVHGGGQVGEALSLHPDVDLLTFTGSTQTGKRLLSAAGASNMKRLILECGGKAPNIVFDDNPNLDAIADAIVARAFWNQGEVCTASSRLLVQHGAKEALLARVIEKAAALELGDPLRAETQFGALGRVDKRFQP